MQFWTQTDQIAPNFIFVSLLNYGWDLNENCNLPVNRRKVKHHQH